MTLDGLITHVRRLLLLGLCIGLTSLWAASIRAGAHGEMSAADFGAVYYSARCGLEHGDPYNPQTVLREFEADGQRLMGAPGSANRHNFLLLQSVALYPPTTYLEIAPLAMLKWRAALTVWLSVMAGLLVVAALLMWDLAAKAPVVAGCLGCWMLLNCVCLFWFGSPAGIGIPLCVIAAWCLVMKRWAWVGVAVLAVTLAMKPQDAGFVWLYFLLAGGTDRKWAWWTLALTAVLGVCAVVWMAPSSPHWLGEMQRNIASFSVRGGPSDPGLSWAHYNPEVCLQNTLAIFDHESRFYNPVSFAIGGGLILAWMLAVLRKRSTREGAVLGLAAASALTMLPVYHRTYDAKLLLLAIPACAMLWASGGVRRWTALTLTSAAIFVTSDYPDVVLVMRTGRMPISDATLSGKLTLLALHPAPLVLLAAGCFYLWVYWRYEAPSEGAVEQQEAAMKPAAASA